MRMLGRQWFLLAAKQCIIESWLLCTLGLLACKSQKRLAHTTSTRFSPVKV
ncbi:hypothetical protein BT96DRAFT_666513 [Gymnopus androsaceus JB14]|uniref:Uncharacterized protein n=1 Tax=Gymnopus androsaceus JB14 TaxID=1447944 RepID=A0A6A4IHA4_9AGAR|nr:hypothetical protein BT96DRAFT_666513 [Gymnopus androsaceus JB14]